MSENQQGLRVTVFGATGVAGGGVVRACLNDPRVQEVRAVTRRSLKVTSEKLREVRCEDFARPEVLGDALDGVDALCFCLGISTFQVGSEDEYRVITHDYALAAARALKVASPEATFHFLSGAGTHVKSRMMWARVKAETEQELRQLDLGSLVCWRPAMILADQPPPSLPWSHRVAYPVMRLLSFVPSLSIRADELGQAMLEVTLAGRREGTLENREIRAAAKRNLYS